MLKKIPDTCYTIFIYYFFCIVGGGLGSVLQFKRVWGGGGGGSAAKTVAMQVKNNSKTCSQFFCEYFDMNQTIRFVIQEIVQSQW